jgi:hypothetical protein
MVLGPDGDNWTSGRYVRRKGMAGQTGLQDLAICGLRRRTRHERVPDHVADREPHPHTTVDGAREASLVCLVSN